jgi:hypothetical protein
MSPDFAFIAQDVYNEPIETKYKLATGGHFLLELQFTLFDKMTAN